jgi:hypothetical protein
VCLSDVSQLISLTLLSEKTNKHDRAPLKASSAASKNPPSPKEDSWIWRERPTRNISDAKTEEWSKAGMHVPKILVFKPLKCFS